MEDENGPGAGDAEAGNVAQLDGREHSPSTADRAESKTWRDLIEVHPAADQFPLMEGKELEDLVSDIREHNGIKVPLVFWKDPDTGKRLLLDGRNRLNAVEHALGPIVLRDRLCPIVEVLIGEDVILHSKVATGDPSEIVLSLNVRRRH